MATIGNASEAKMADVTIEEIRTWWKVPSIAHFCSLFRGTFSLPDFEIEELEEALFLDAQEEAASSFLIELLVQLLRGCYQRKDIDHHNYLDFLRDTLKHRWEVEEKRVNPLGNEDTTFKSLSTLMKVEVMNALCDYRLDAPDVSALKDFYGEHLRIEPLGKDGSGALYWYFYGTRLYREEKEITKEERDKKRKQRLKEKKKKLRELQAARRKLKQKEKVKKEKPKKEKETKKKRQKKGEVASGSDGDEDDEDEDEPKTKGKKGKNAKQPKSKSKKAKDESDEDEEEEEKGKTKKRGKRTKKQEEEEDEEKTPKKGGRKCKKDEENEDKTPKTPKKRGRQPKKEESPEETSPKRRGRTPKKQSKEDIEIENERTKRGAAAKKKAASEAESGKRGRKNDKKNSKEVQTNGENEGDGEPMSADESDDQPLSKLKGSPDSKVDSTTPKKRGRATKKVEEEDKPEPKKRGRTPKKAKEEEEEEEEKTPTKRGRAKKVKEEASQQVLKEEPKGTKSPRGKKIKEEADIKQNNGTGTAAKKGSNTKAIKEEATEDTNTEDASTAPSTATSIPVSSEESSDDDLDDAPRWHLVCHTEEDWTALTEKFKKSRLKCERELYKILLNDFLPEIKSLFAEKERELRKRLLEMAPKRISDRIVTLRIKQEEEERTAAILKAESDARRKALAQARKERALTMKRQKDSEEFERETKQRKDAREKRAKLRERRLEYIREGKPIPPEFQKELDSNAALRWKSSVDDDEEETYLGLMKVLDTIKTHPDSWPFLEPVSETYAPGYYNIISLPMDLSTMERKLNDKVYSGKDEFVNDMHQIFQNCVDYNGPGNEYTIMAETLENAFDKSMDMHFPDAEDSETDDDDFTTAEYYRETRGIRRTPLRHTSRNTSASRAKMEMSVHTMMQSSSAESSPHSSDNEYDGTETSETNENMENNTEKNLENGEVDTNDKSETNAKDEQKSIFKQQTKNFQAGFEKFVKVNAVNPVKKSAASTEKKAGVKRPRKQDTEGKTKRPRKTNKESKTNEDETNADNVTKEDQIDKDNAPKDSDITATLNSETNVNDTNKNIANVGTTVREEENGKPVVAESSLPVTGQEVNSGSNAEAKNEIADPTGDGAKKPERKKRKYVRRKKPEEVQNDNATEAKKDGDKPNTAEQCSDTQSNIPTVDSGEPKPKEKKKRERKKKEPKEGDQEKKPRKRRSKKDAENNATNENQDNATASDNNNVDSNIESTGRTVSVGQQRFVLHKVDCEPGKFSPSIDGHEAKIIRVPNPMHSANRHLAASEQSLGEENRSHEISIQTENEISQRHETPQEWSGSNDSNQTGSVLGQFLNPQEHNFLQGGGGGSGNMQKDNAAEPCRSRESSVSSEHGSQRVPPPSSHNYMSPPHSSPPYYPPQQSDYLHQSSGPPSHEQPQPQPLVSNLTQDSVQQHHQQQQQQQQHHNMIDLNSRRPPHPFQPPPPQRHDISQPGLPSAFQRLPYHHQLNRSDSGSSHSQDGYNQPSVITKVPNIGSNSNSTSDYSATTTTPPVVSGNTNTAEGAYRPPAPLQPVDQYHHGQFSSHGGYGGPPYWDRHMPPGGYNPPQSSGYNPPQSSGYNPPQSSGYNPPQSSGYNPPTPGSYNPPTPGGYNNPPTPGSYNNPGNTPSYNPPTTPSYNSPPAASHNAPPAASHNAPATGSYNPPTTPSYNPPTEAGDNTPTTESYNTSTTQSYNTVTTQSHTPPTTQSHTPPTSTSPAPLTSSSPAATTVIRQDGEKLERQVETPPTNKIWRPHSTDQPESSSSSRPPSNVASMESQPLESKTDSEQGQNKMLHKSPQGANSHPASPALSSSSHGNKGGESGSHSAFASPRPPSVGGGSSSQLPPPPPLAVAGSPLQPQTSPAAAGAGSSHNSLPPRSPQLMTDSRVPLSSPPQLQPLTSPPGSTTEPLRTEGMPTSMQGLLAQASGSSMNYRTMLNSEPSMQEYLEAERMRRTPDLHRYMEMNGSRFGMPPMQSASPYASHAMQQMSQSSASMYGNQLPPMPASQPLPASFSSYGVAASPHLRQLLHNRIPGSAGNQMSPHSAYATQSPLGMGLGPASSMYAGYDRQGPYSAPHGYNMQQAAELQYYQQRTQALHKQGYYPQPGSQYLDTQPPNVAPSPYNPATMMGGSHLPPGYE